MTRANCPSCGAGVEFRALHSLYRVCDACGSLLVRQDVNVEDLGKIASVQPDGTPLQVGTRGSWRGTSFELVGRLQVRTAHGGYWNEWYALFADGKEGWLGEAMGEYLITFAGPAEGLPAYEELTVGLRLVVGSQSLAVTDRGSATVVSYEGEIPFLMPAGYELPSVDLRGIQGQAATIDYSEEAPLLFLGEYVPVDSLSLSGLRDEGEGPGATAKVRAFKCTNCGAPQEVKAEGLSQVLVCAHCDTALDLRDPEFGRLYTAQQARARVPALLPLGTRGAVGGITWEVLGYLRRSVVVQGTRYAWSEYLLYERLHGYRWLSESQGHWTWMEPLGAVPAHPGGAPIGDAPPAEVHYQNEKYRHFQRAVAEVNYVAGEFYWKVQAGESARCDDYVAPPSSLSAETTADGIVWSRGTYLTGGQIWKAFSLPGSPPAPVGVGPSQPNPARKGLETMWMTYLVTVMLGFLLMVGYSMKVEGPVKSVSYDAFKYEPERSRITEPFTLPGRGNVEITIETNAANRWAFFQLTLINADTGMAWDTGKTISYYLDSEGSEGSNHGTVMIPQVPPGSYMLRVEPTTGTGESPDTSDDPKAGEQNLLHYTLTVYRDVPEWMLLWLMAGVLIIPPVWTTWRSSSMETKRWSESDYAP